MNILVFNCGSSSLKYRLLRMPEEVELAGGEAQRVGTRTAARGCIYHRVGAQREEIEAELPDHAAAFQQVLAILGRDRGLGGRSSPWRAEVSPARLHERRLAAAPAAMPPMRKLRLSWPRWACPEPASTCRGASRFTVESWSWS